MTRLSSALCALMAIACGGTSAPADGGGLDPEAARTSAAAVSALGFAVSLTAPLVEDAQQLRDATSPDLPTREANARTRVEDGVSGGSVVTPPECATYSWAGLTVTTTFAGCTLEASGESLDGTVELTVSFAPTTFTLVFRALAIGATTVDGSLALNVGGGCSDADTTCRPCRDTDPDCVAMRESQQTLTGSITIVGETTSLSITELTLVYDATGATVGGSFTSGSLSFVATDVRWNRGECLPTSGSVAIPATRTTIGFLPTTPADGVVRVTVEPFPAVDQMLFEPC